LHMAEETENGDADANSDTDAPAPAGEPGGVAFDDLSGAGKDGDGPRPGDSQEQRTATDLEPVFDVPVKVQAVLGRSNLEVSQLLKLAPGAVLELDRKIGEAIDIYVNNRLVARGEVVLVEDHLGVTMTEIVKTEQN